MKLLVTGGAGFIGSNFIRWMLEQDRSQTVSIVNVDALTYAGNRENLADFEGDSRYHFVRGDIGDAVLMDQLVADCDGVVHFAAESHVDRSILGPSVFVQTNVLGTLVLLEAARKYGKRFHHVSTDEVFGSLAKDEPAFSETTPYSPRSPYSASKAGSDHLVRAYFHTYGLPVTLSNCSNNYGPYHFPEKLIPLAITNVIEGKRVPVYGNGTQIRDWLFVEDHCRAIALILERGVLGETYCIGGGAERENIVVVREILRFMGAAEDVIEYVKDRPGHDQRYAMNFSKIERELGWKPSVSFEEGLGRTVQWFQEHESWWRRVKSGEYQTYYEQQYRR